MKNSVKKGFLISLFSIVLPIQAFAYCNNFNPETNVFRLEALGVKAGTTMLGYLSLDFNFYGQCDSTDKACLTLDPESITLSESGACSGDANDSIAILNPFTLRYTFIVPTMTIGDTEYLDATFTFPVQCGGNPNCLRLDSLIEKPPVVTIVEDVVEDIIDAVEDIF